MKNFVKRNARRTVRTFHKVTPVRPPRTAHALTSRHYRRWASPHHVTRLGMETGISMLNESSATFVETGTSAWGINSTRLFADYVRLFGGEVRTVDIRSEPSQRLKNLEKVVMFNIGDSVEYLERLHLPNEERQRFFYLDSWDVDWDAPEAAANHGFREWRAIQRLARAGDIVVIDDTPSSIEFIPPSSRDAGMKFKDLHGVLPGKGSLVLLELIESREWKIVFHAYNVVIQRL